MLACVLCASPWLAKRAWRKWTSMAYREPPAVAPGSPAASRASTTSKASTGERARAASLSVRTASPTELTNFSLLTNSAKETLAAADKVENTEIETTETTNKHTFAEIDSRKKDNQQYSFAKIIQKIVKGKVCAQIEYAIKHQDKVFKNVFYFIQLIRSILHYLKLGHQPLCLYYSLYLRPETRVVTG